MAKQTIYTVGGTVQAGGGIYIKRKADDELLDLCRHGEFAFILSSRQVGKSSLMVRTAQQLEEENIRSVTIDLSAIGVNVTQDEWYLGILNEIYSALALETDIFAWWKQFAGLGPAQRLTNFFKDVLLKEVQGPVVLFFDEIDSTLSIRFSDDFYVALRAVYNARSTNPVFKRLSFVLVGVAAPGDLISDSKRTPFNIGRRVEIRDFTLTEAMALAQGLGEQAEQVLTWVFQYTGGHPYLTQRLCAYLANSKNAVTEQDVATAVGKLFTGDQGKQDNNLQFVRDMLLSKRSPDARRILLIYRDIRSGKKIKDDERSIAKAHLKLSGLVRSEQGILCVRNEIYNRVFSQRWVNENIPKNWTKIVAYSLGFVSVFLLSIFVYDFVVGNLSSQYVDRFYGSPAASDKLQYLARIFDLEGILPNADYDSRARDLFFSLGVNDQEALFKKSSPAAKAKHLSTVVRGLYVTMANVEGGEDSTDLLKIMKDALTNIDPPLYVEIDLWLQARDAPTNEEALAKYNAAIQSNGENPATRYERAAVEIDLEQYQQALLDLNSTMALAKNLSTEAAEKEMPTPPPLPSGTHLPPTSVSKEATLQVAPDATPAVISSLAPTQFPTATEGTPPISKTPRPAETQTQSETAPGTEVPFISTPDEPSDTSLSVSYRSNFFSRAYIRSAVDTLLQKIVQTPEVRLLLIESQNYPELASNGLLPSVELTPDLAGTESAGTVTGETPDLTRVADLAADSPAVGGANKIAFVANNDIWVMNVDGSELIQITADGGTKSDVQWLDRDTILFLSGKTIKFYQLSTDTVEILTSFPSASSLTAFQISHNGNQVMIGLDNEIFVIPFDLEAMKAINRRAALLAVNGACIVPTGKTMAALRVKEARWSTDDKLVAWLYKGVDANDSSLQAEQVSVLNIQSCQPELIDLLDTFPGTRFIPQGYENRLLPDFDWDGFDQFAFNTSKRNNGWGELYIYNWQTHNATLINPIDGSCCYRDARWSPDGRYLLFAFQEENQTATTATVLYYVPVGELGTAAVFQPLPLPDGFFRDAKEAPQLALRPSGETVSVPVESVPATPPSEMTDNQGIEMVLVPAGDFDMGSAKGEADEQPVHTVYLDSFFIDKFEVTNRSYKVCVDTGVCEPPRQLYFFAESPNRIYFDNPQYDNYPVIYVDWNMAKNYCEWRDARLPTEAEWEKAARGTAGATYPWGNDLDCQKANYQRCVNRTSEVGSFPDGISPYGAYDMAGNVWEWVADWYSDSFYSNSPESNPLGPNSGQSRVLRGGSWPQFDVTTYHRLRFAPTYYTFDIGFRCARSE